MGVGAGLYMWDVVKKFTFAISSPDEFLFNNVLWRKKIRWQIHATIEIDAGTALQSRRCFDVRTYNGL